MEKTLTQTAIDFASTEKEKSLLKFEQSKKNIEINKSPSSKKDEFRNEDKPRSVLPRGRKSLKEMDVELDLIQIPDDEVLFQKQYYSIGEVAGMFRVNQSLLRYWESEFDILQPRKNKKGDRFFRPQDIKNLLLIYDLLRRRKFTIVGAKDYLKQHKKAEEKFVAIKSLEKIKTFLLELKVNL